MPHTNEKEIKSEVNVKHAGNGFMIMIEDQFTKNSIVVTREELEKIVLYGQVILKQNESTK